MRLLVWQVIYIVAGAVILPFAPLLYLQGQYTRRRVGLLPDAKGGPTGLYGEGDNPAKLFVIGESTVAGLGASTHDRAFAGQFAKQLSDRIGRPVGWTVIGKNGVTAGRTIRELVPQIPDERFDYILVGLGGNDVLKLSSPVKWRRDMTRLLEILRERNPDAVIFLSNCPMIKASPAIPQPIKFLLWKLSNMHDANAREMTAAMDRVFYYHQPREIEVEGFFADGIHPSEKGYADWTEAMMRFFDECYEWNRPSKQKPF
jgi:lysophospholipase L1-like esterase